MIRAILFDLGDTLLDFEPMDTRAVFREAAAGAYERLGREGVALPGFERYAGVYYRWMRWSYLWAKVRRREFNAHELLRRFHLRMGLPVDEELLREVQWLWYEPVVRRTRVDERLRATLIAMREAGLSLGVLSNTFMPGFVHDRHLELAGLLEFLPVRVYSSEVRYRKPDRRIFRLAAERLGVPAAETLFVGDLVKTDIIGARRAGMRTALRQPFANLRAHRIADHVVRQVAELMEVLPGLGAVARAGDRHGAC